MRTELTAKRRQEIAKLLVQNGDMKAKELSVRFGVSTETIRKDLIYLEEQGIARKSYGGAMACSDLLERPVALKEMEHMEIKTAIASRALELIPENGVILLDAGSTTYALAKLLTLRDDLTIFTNSVPILNLLSDSGNQVFALGGRVRGSSKGIVGGWAIEAIRQTHVELAFLGSDGFQNLSGPSTLSYEEAQLKQAVMAHSGKTVILSDNRKFYTGSLFQFCRWDQVYALVTNHTQDTQDEIFHSALEIIKKDTQILFS